MTGSVLATVVAVVACTARAASADPKADAQRKIERATVLHHQGAFAEALDELLLAYSLDPRAEILYAMGQLNVKLGRCADAIAYYQRFLGTAPTEGTDAARQAIERCTIEPPLPPPPTPTPPPSPTPPPPPPVVVVATRTIAPRPAWYTDGVGDALVGGGIVAGLVGVAFYSMARNALDDADASLTYQDHREAVDRAHADRTVAVVFGVAGVALVGAGIARFILHDVTPDVGIEPATGGGVVTWSARFR